MKYSKYFGTKRRRFIKSKSVLAPKGTIHLLNENITYDISPFLRGGLYQNDISIKSSNVKLNINDVCNLIRMLKSASNASVLIKKLIKRERSNLF